MAYNYYSRFIQCVRVKKERVGEGTGAGGGLRDVLRHHRIRIRRRGTGHGALDVGGGGTTHCMNL